jgi:hypothetical protein
MQSYCPDLSRMPHILDWAMKIGKPYHFNSREVKRWHSWRRLNLLPQATQNIKCIPNFEIPLEKIRGNDPTIELVSHLGEMEVGTG